MNYHNLGLETGKITARILKGEKADDIAVYSASELDLMVSKKNASEQGLSVPQSILDKAKTVVE